MIVLAYAFSFLLILVIWRKMHNDFASKKFKYNLFKLRSELRMYAINQEINPKSKSFIFLDNTISKTIQNHYTITLFTLISMKVLADMEEIERENEVISFLESEADKNEHVKLIIEKYTNFVDAYLIEQHYVTAIVLIKPIFIGMLGLKSIKKMYNEQVKRAIVMPNVAAPIFFQPTS